MPLDILNTVVEARVKTLSTLSAQEWNEIRERYGVTRLLIWREPPGHSKGGPRHPVGARRLEDGSYEVQINADAVRCRPRVVPHEQYTLYALYHCVAHIALGHLDEERQQELLGSRVSRGAHRGLKSLRDDMDRAATEWALGHLGLEGAQNAA